MLFLFPSISSFLKRIHAVLYIAEFLFDPVLSQFCPGRHTFQSNVSRHNCRLLFLIEPWFRLFACPFLCIFTILIPRLIAGAPILPTVLMICAFVTVVTFVILDGVNWKTICAIFGTILGFCFSAIFGKFACWLLRISGLSVLDVDPAIEFLLQMKQARVVDGVSSIQLSDLLVGGILIAAFGAVNNVAMSISSAMNELIAVKQDLSHRELLKSGMNIGRDMVGP